MKKLLNNIRRYWSGSIRRQLMVGIIFVHAVLMSLFVYDLVERQSDFLHKQSISQANSLSQTLAANSVSWILSDDVVGLEEVLQSQRHYPDLRYAMVLSPEGRVLGHTEKDKVGLYISDEVISLLLSPEKDQRILFDSNRAIDVVSPIFSNEQLVGWARVGLGQDEIALGLKLITRDGIIYTILAIIIGSLFAFFMAKSMTRDLGHLVGVADGIKQGDLHVRSSMVREDEIGQLSADFNLMLEALNKSEELQKNYQRTLEKRVEERTTELQKKAVELMRATRLKSEFLANMSHELRTPMNSIIGFTGRVIKKSSGALDEKQINNLRTVERNAYHLLELINGLLDLSKIEAGKMDAHAEMFKLGALAREVFSLTQPMLENKPVKLIVDLPVADIQLNTDNIKLKQVLINLVSNAVKFTDEGSVTIAAQIERNVSEPKVIIRVTDTGVGMSEEALQYIFEAFRQVDGTLTRKVGGTGLGLAIVRSFTELLQGTVSVESEKGVGTTFELIIPTSLDSKPVKAEVSEISLLQRQSLTNEKQTILCIDDEVEALELISEYLGDEGYQVVTVSDAEEGLALAKEIQPFAITLDIMMPQKDGWSVLSELKTAEETRGIPVFIISFLDNKALGYQLGAFDYMQKPINPERLINGIERLLVSGMARALVVDDDSESRDLLCQILTDADIECEVAIDGNDAIAVLERHAEQPPGLILLDLMMPGMDGFELLEKLQENAMWAKIPVVVVTAKTLEEHEREFLQPRVASILAKEGLTTEQVLKRLAVAMECVKERSV